MTTEDNGALRRTGPGETAEATTPTIEHPDPDESIIRLWQERGRLTAEADRILTLAGDDEDFKAQQRADALDEKDRARHLRRPPLPDSQAVRS